MNKKTYQTIHTKGYPRVLGMFNKIMRTPHPESQGIHIGEPRPMTTEEVKELRDSGFTGEIKGGYVVKEK